MWFRLSTTWIGQLTADEIVMFEISGVLLNKIELSVLGTTIRYREGCAGS